jgi:hypothetical protein
VGTLSAGPEWFKPWRTVHGDALAEATTPQMQVVIESIFAPRRFLDLVRACLVFEDDDGRLVKKMARYHQFHAVQVAVAATLRAAELARADLAAEAMRAYEVRRKPGGTPGDRRVGVVWHTPGLRQEPHHGLLRRPHHPRAGDGEPDHRRPHRPQRSRRPALRHLLALRAVGSAAITA